MLKVQWAKDRIAGADADKTEANEDSSPFKLRMTIAKSTPEIWADRK